MMSRLYDRCLAKNWSDLAGYQPVIDATNVVEYAFSCPSPYDWKVNFEDLPNLAPPYPRMFIESGPPVYFNQRFKTKYTSIGLAVKTISDTDSKANLHDLRDHPCLSGVDPDSVKWTLSSTLYSESTSWPGINQLHQSDFYFIQEDGSPMTGVAFLNNPVATKKIVPTVKVTDFYQPLYNSLLMAICFMHCKNVKQVECESEQSRQERRQRERKGLEPLSRYIVLNINPMKEVLKTGGGSEETGIRQALHICRGHFSTYTEEKPLFGKVAGTFWIPQHLKGTPKAGKVDKDYAIVGLK